MQASPALPCRCTLMPSLLALQLGRAPLQGNPAMPQPWWVQCDLARGLPEPLCLLQFTGRVYSAGRERSRCRLMSDRWWLAAAPQKRRSCFDGSFAASLASSSLRSEVKPV